MPDEDLSLAFFRATRELTAARGLPAYEVSNHASPGGESRHNLVYWRYGEYAGVGPGAHGRLVTPEGRLAQACERRPEDWLTRVETEGHGLIENAALTPEEQGDEFLLMGLRLSEGVDPDRYAAISGRKLDRGRLKGLVADGFLERDPEGRLRVTPRALRSSTRWWRMSQRDPAAPPSDDHAPHRRRLGRLVDRLPGRFRAAALWLLRPESRWARIPAGVLLILGGLLAVLPVFGLWMLPLGVVLIAEDVPVLRRGVGRALAWLERRWPRLFEPRGDD